MRNFGPRIYVKRDEESTIKRGCRLYGAHFRPEIAAIPHAACNVAHHAYPKFTECWLTEGFRDVREERDLHEEQRALDITFRTQGGWRPTREEYDRVADGMRIVLGRDYDIQVHGKGDNLHIHCELDPK